MDSSQKDKGGRLVFVCQVFHPDPQATSQLFSDLFSRLAARGDSYEVLAGFPVGGSKDSRWEAKEVWEGILIRRGGLRTNYRRSLMARGVGYMFFCLWLVWRLIFLTPKCAHIVVATNPPFAPVLVFLCAKFRRLRYDVMLLDIYPDGLVAVGKMAERSPIAMLWGSMNRRALASARVVMVLGRDMARLCEQRYGLPTDRIKYTPHWAAVSGCLWLAAEETKLWQRLRLGGKFVVQYSGNMGLWHDVNCIVRAAEILRDEPNISFLMIGAGMRRLEAEQFSVSLGLPNILWLPFQPMEQLGDSLACCHVALISQRSGLSGVAVPCKLYGILASGRLALAQVPNDSEVAMVLEEEGCGIVTAPGDAATLAETIRTLARDRDLVLAMGRRAFSAYQTKYTVEIAADTFHAIWHEQAN
jgi:colanic acid biosynthesis glycosyl transferase WcaI